MWRHYITKPIDNHKRIIHSSLTQKINYGKGMFCVLYGRIISPRIIMYRVDGSTDDCIQRLARSLVKHTNLIVGYDTTTQYHDTACREQVIT